MFNKKKQKKKGGKKDNQWTNVFFCLPVLLFGLHNDKVPFVVNFFVQEIVIFLEMENKKNTKPRDILVCRRQKALSQ